MWVAILHLGVLLQPQEMGINYTSPSQVDTLTRTNNTDVSEQDTLTVTDTSVSQADTMTVTKRTKRQESVTDNEEDDKGEINVSPLIISY